MFKSSKIKERRKFPRIKTGCKVKFTQVDKDPLFTTANSTNIAADIDMDGDIDIIAHKTIGSSGLYLH